MARGRMISKALSTSEKWAALHETAGKLAEFCQALYPLLLAHTDDWGVVPGDPFTVKHLVNPTSPRRLPDFRAALVALHNVGLINWYLHEDKWWIAIVGFSAHQNLHGNDRRPRTSPPPPEKPSVFEDSATTRYNSLEPALREEKGREEKRTEGKRRELKRTEEKRTEEARAIETPTGATTPTALVTRARASDASTGADPPKAEPAFVERRAASRTTDLEALRAGDFVERYAELHVKFRHGAPYVGKMHFDFQEALQLVKVYDDARLDKLAEVWFRTDHDFAENGTRTLAKFRSMASWCDERLRKAGL